MTDDQRTIICGTDFSRGATAALRWAARLAAKSGDCIDLVSVIAPAASSSSALMADAAAIDDAVLAAMTDRLRSVAEEAARKHAVRVTPYVLHGDAHRQIADHAAKRGAWLLVVGAHGGSRVGRWLLGSVAERIVRIATLPVAVIPPRVAPEETMDGPVPLRVLVGLERGAAGDRALKVARQLRAIQPCALTVLHLYWPIVEYQRLGLQGSRDLFAPDPDVIRNLEPALREQIGDLVAGGPVGLLVRPAWGDPAANLLVVADEGDFGLLIVGAERRHGLARLSHPSVSQRLVRHVAGAALICVPPAAISEPPPPPEQPPRISTVLVPTDLSPTGNAALPYAYGLLAAHGGVVELCHVHRRTLPNPSFAYDQPLDKLSPTAVADLERRLHALVPPYAAAMGITTHVSIIEGGAPAEAIVQAAERLAVDIIALGAHGHGRAAGVLLGSVAEAVVRNSRRPVLVAPGHRDHE
jgi:nucleotide-binding universal stress UspA family protein